MVEKSQEQRALDLLEELSESLTNLSTHQALPREAKELITAETERIDMFLAESVEPYDPEYEVDEYDDEDDWEGDDPAEASGE